MATNSTLPAALPNPFTPLAFLPPSLANQVEASTYLSVGALSASIWDWLLTIPDEIKMCRKRRFSLVVVMYFLSRVGTVSFCAGGVILQVASVPPSHCRGLKNLVEGFFIVAVPSTSALFFFRVKAVYGNNRIITVLFGFLLFSLLGLSFLTPFGVELEGDFRGRCVSKKISSYASTPIVVNCIIDTLVYIAISLRIASYSIVGDTFSARMKSFFRGDGLPTLSRCLLQDGQFYYFATIGLNVAVAVLVLAPVPQIYHTILIVPHVALNSAMACRVFRGIRLGFIRDSTGLALEPTTIRFVRESSPTSTKEYPLQMQAFDGSQNNPVVVEIARRPDSGGPYVCPETDPDGCHDGQDGRYDDTSEISVVRV